MRKIARREDIRDLILDGVDALLARYGYRKMTMEDLAGQVGIGKGTIYLHFPSKEELALSHVDRIVERVLARLWAIARGSEPPAVRIKRMLVTRVLDRYDSVARYSQNLNDLLSAVRKELLIRRQAHFEKEAKVVAGVLEEGLRSGAFKYPDSREAAWILIWSTNSLLPFSLTARELGRRNELEERVSLIADVLLAGLRPRRESRTIRKT
jgi:AcrR family transcriptional regulator